LSKLRVNGESKSTNERGPSLVGSLGLDPMAQQAGQAAVLGRLSLSACVSGWERKRRCGRKRSEGMVETEQKEW
jgi:hypothetical protein